MHGEYCGCHQHRFNYYGDTVRAIPFGPAFEAEADRLTNKFDTASNLRHRGIWALRLCDLYRAADKIAAEREVPA